jgi:diguanylate cyclase (GGDEF)-like protein
LAALTNTSWVSVPADDGARAATGLALRRALTRARQTYAEQPEAALVQALRSQELARSLDEPALTARAQTLQGLLAIHRGDLRSGVTLAVAAAAEAERSGELAAQAEVASLRSLLSLFTGAYAEAVIEARAALGLADQDGDPQLRLFVRQCTRPVFANLGAPEMRAELELSLDLAGDDAREQAICRNDLATLLTQRGELDAASQEIERALALLEDLPDARFVRAAAHITRSEIRGASGDPRGALLDSRYGMDLLLADAAPNPYHLGAAIGTQVAGLIALGELDEAQRLGEETVTTLGERLPQIRSQILASLAEALHRAGRLEEAYTTLTRASRLERQALRELTDLQLGLERATLEAREARRHADELLARNNQLAEAHAELMRRSGELEQLHEQLVDQAERDWLTGLHNRRLLERRVEEIEGLVQPLPVSLAILDIDHFKTINDRFGHPVGDRVLIWVARVLESLLHRRDTVVRSGGEEFVLLMPATDARLAAIKCERIRARIEAQPWSEIVAGLTVCASIGIGFTENPSRIREIMRQADQRLYEAKRTGRNRVVGGPAH